MAHTDGPAAHDAAHEQHASGIDDPMPIEEVNFFDPAVNDCPYHAYRTLRDDAPVWFDPRLRGYVITRYEDVRTLLVDTERFVNGSRRSMRPEIKTLYEEKGWVPGRTLAGRDDPEHRQMRALFDQRLGQVRRLRAWCDRLVQWNRGAREFPSEAFERIVEHRWQRVFHHLADRSFRAAISHLIIGPRSWASVRYLLRVTLRRLLGSR